MECYLRNRYNMNLRRPTEPRFGGEGHFMLQPKPTFAPPTPLLWEPPPSSSVAAMMLTTPLVWRSLTPTAAAPAAAAPAAPAPAPAPLPAQSPSLSRAHSLTLRRLKGLASDGTPPPPLGSTCSPQQYPDPARGCRRSRFL